MGFIGGVGMLSAGLLGGPGIGYKQDYYASAELKEESKATFQRYAAKDENSFLFFPKVQGLDNQKVAVLKDDGAALKTTIARMKKADITNEDIERLEEWWKGPSKISKSTDSPSVDSQKLGARAYAKEDKPLVTEAVIYGGRMALILTAGVPAFMAVGFLILVLYFRAKGGYQAEVLHGEQPDGERYTGGVEGPVE